MLTSTTEAAGTSLTWVQRTSAPTPCTCPLCGHGRAVTTIKHALRDLDAATDAWIEVDGDTECNLAYLRGEVAAAVAGPLSQVKGRLREALRTVAKEASA